MNQLVDFYQSLPFAIKLLIDWVLIESICEIYRELLNKTLSKKFYQSVQKKGFFVLNKQKFKVAETIDYSSGDDVLAGIERYPIER